MEDFIMLICLIVFIVYSVFSFLEHLASLIGLLMLRYLKKSLPKLALMMFSLHPPSKNHDMEWAESIIAVEKGLTMGMLQALEKEPDLIYTADAGGETVLHVLAKSDMGDAITISICSEIMEIVEKARMKRVLVKKNTNGDTPLHLALKKKDQEFVYWLILVNSRAAFVYNNDRVRPYELIKEAGYSKVLKKIPTIQLQAHCSDIEMGLIRRDIDNLEEPSSKARTWIDPVPKDLRQAFLKAAKGLFRSNQIKWHVKAYGGNILHWAATSRHVDLMRLLEKFTSNNELASLALERDIYGNLPLHGTLESYCDIAASLFLIRVAPEAAFFPNRKGVTPLYMATESGCQDLVREIFLRAPRTSIDESLRKNLLTKKASVVHAAVRCRKLGILAIILNQLPDSIDTFDERGWRPLSYAAYEGYCDGVFYFLKTLPKSVTKYDLDGSFPVHKAVAGGHVSIVEQFILYCPSTIKHFDSKGRSILHIAVSYSKADVFSYLTKKKEVKELFHHKDNDGQTFVELANQLKTGTANFLNVWK